MSRTIVTVSQPPADAERGATAVEYALLVMLIAGILIAVFGFLGQDVLGLFTSVNW